MNELVTVYIPTHNRSAMLKRAVDSVIRQSYKKIEIIISDDGSSDNTELIVKQLMQEHDNIYYIRSNTPKGACHARNCAIKMAKGEYITGLDDDDEFSEKRVEELLKIAKKNSNYSFISSGILRIEKKGIGYNYINSRELTCEMIKNSNCVGNQVFIRTQYLRDINGFDESLAAWQDYDCWLRIISQFGTAYNCALFNYIMHTEHESGRITKSGKVKSAVEYFLNKHNSLLSKNNIKNIKFNYLLYYSEENRIVSLLKNLTIVNVCLYSRFLIGNFINTFRNLLSSRGRHEG